MLFKDDSKVNEEPYQYGRMWREEPPYGQYGADLEQQVNDDQEGYTDDDDRTSPIMVPTASEYDQLPIDQRALLLAALLTPLEGNDGVFCMI